MPKIRSQYDNCHVATEQLPIFFRIMTARQIIYSSAIIVLGFFQFAPCVLLLGSTIIAVALGILYSLALGWFWSSTIIGRWYFRELWRSTLRLENLMSPEV